MASAELKSCVAYNISRSTQGSSRKAGHMTCRVKISLLLTLTLQLLTGRWKRVPCVENPVALSHPDIA